MERLFGVFGDHEPVYEIERVPAHDDEPDVALSFSDVAAHPYAALVAGTVGALRAVPGVVDVWQEDREVVLVRAPWVSLAALADVVDRYWLEALPGTSPDPAYGEVGRPDVSRAWSPAPEEGDLRAGHRSVLNQPIHLGPSRGRMWTYLVCGAIGTIGGMALLASGGGHGGAAMGLGLLNLVVGVRIATRRRALAA